MFFCKICGELHSDEKLSRDEICIYCDVNLVEETISIDPIN